MPFRLLFLQRSRILDPLSRPQSLLRVPLLLPLRLTGPRGKHPRLFLASLPLLPLLRYYCSRPDTRSCACNIYVVERALIVGKKFSLGVYQVESPSTRNTFESVRAKLTELDTRARHQVSDGAGNKDLLGSGFRTHPRGNMDAYPSDIAVDYRINIPRPRQVVISGKFDILCTGDVLREIAAVSDSNIPVTLPVDD